MNTTKEEKIVCTRTNKSTCTPVFMGCEVTGSE